MRRRFAILVLAALAVAAPARAESLAGKLLVADDQLADPHFRHTVVLLVESDEKGAFGIVINRSMAEVEAGELMRDMGRDDQGASGKIEIRMGGPVQPETGWVIHSPDYKAPTTHEVTPEIAVTADPAILDEIAHGKGPTSRIVALGYAGWGAGQLESEMARGDWFTEPADAALVFGTAPDEMWDKAFAARGIEL
ncbi:MAG: YqgE/AlgH family protein [Geminicoccaceae bacterium]